MLEVVGDTMAVKINFCSPNRSWVKYEAEFLLCQMEVYKPVTNSDRNTKASPFLEDTEVLCKPSLTTGLLDSLVEPSSITPISRAHPPNSSSFSLSLHIKGLSVCSISPLHPVISPFFHMGSSPNKILAHLIPCWPLPLRESISHWQSASITTMTTTVDLSVCMHSLIWPHEEDRTIISILQDLGFHLTWLRLSTCPVTQLIKEPGLETIKSWSREHLFNYYTLLSN